MTHPAQHTGVKLRPFVPSFVRHCLSIAPQHLEAEKFVYAPDALNAALRALLASGKLGQHNGLPASFIVTTTLKDLEAAAGKALTGGAACYR